MKVELQKVTAYIPKALLHNAQEVTGVGITETLRYGLNKVLKEKTYSQLSNLYGKYKSSINIKELREDR